MMHGKKKLMARGALVAMICATLSISFAFSRHFVPRGAQQKIITVDHQIRRVLWGAQRETLRDGAAIQKSSVVTQLSPFLASVSILFYPPQRETFLKLETPIAPENLILESSPVLNL